MAKLLNALILEFCFFARTATKVTVTTTTTIIVTVVDCSLTSVTVIVTLTVKTVTAHCPVNKWHILYKCTHQLGRVELS